MKTLITILLATSLSLAAVANAAQEDPKAKKNAKPGPVQKQQVAPKQNVVPKTHVQSVHSQRVQNVNSAKIDQINGSGPKHHKPITTTTPPTNVNKPPVRALNVAPSSIPQPQNQNVSRNQKSVKSARLPVTNAQSDQLPAIQNNPPGSPNTAVVPKTTSIPNVQNIQTKYKNFRAQPRPAAIASAQFNQNYRIAGAQNWSGPQYQAFSSYHPQWHDQSWWQANYASNLLLIAGGWYYWNAGYWYPAWGYDPGAAYYPYDGPIYTGETRRPFDEVVADVQASLQEQGYYRGEVDGLMGPLTREALAGFQRDHGLITTAALDQPTLASLGLG